MSLAQTKIRAALVHFFLSSIIAAFVAFLVFYFWFSWPYRDLVGGRELFWLIVSVDVVCGPLLTAIVYNKNKPRRELLTDIGCIALIQLIALGYGGYTLFNARPLYLAFEVDRFRAVTYSDILKDDLQPESNPLHQIPWNGVRLIGTRTLVDGNEMLESLELSIQGYSPATRPDWWQDYEKNHEDVRQRAKPVAILIKNNPDNTTQIQTEITRANKKEEDIIWLPVTSFRSLEWVALMDKQTLQPFAFLPIDGFEARKEKPESAVDN